VPIKHRGYFFARDNQKQVSMWVLHTRRRNEERLRRMSRRNEQNLPKTTGGVYPPPLISEG
jgi:hypothetical protein